ncbi:hypothetical protein [Sphingomonas sp.]|uniref:hypothetical protein n=1 Tax=Sphingomonas sp. TaxID=28214 RepID=UPI0025ECD135|nr:hypothetical protein [Sphingomonas sp.]
MRSIPCLVLLLVACSQQPAEPTLTGGTFAGAGRDRLCIAGEAGAPRAGFIAYGEGDVNCSAAGRLQRSGQGWVLVPKGEGDCHIPLEIAENSARIGQPPAACSYYCGPGTKLAGKTFNRADAATKAVDLAGDSLC